MRNLLKSFSSRLAVAASLALSVGGSALMLTTLSEPAAANPFAPQPRIVTGDSTGVSGATVQTWAKVLPTGRVTEVGVTLPLAVATNPPTSEGTGPQGAVAVLDFPAVVQKTTYFNHFEMQWERAGHRPFPAWMVPHYDLHFFGVPLASVLTIGPVDPQPPAPDRIPAGYIYPSPLASVPQMGVHAIQPADADPSHVFTADMIAGFYGGSMIFVEPMVTQAALLQRQDFSLEVPMPQTLGRSTLYPTQFEATYDRKAQVYYLVFSGFELMR